MSMGFSDESATQRRARNFVAFSLVVLIFAAVLYAFFAPALVEAIYEHRSWPPLHRLVPHPVKHSLAHYQQKGRIVFTNGVLVVLGIDLLVLFLAYRRRVYAFLTTFLFEADDPLNLAIFRAAVFGTLLLMVEFDESLVLFFSRMPADMRVSPWGWSLVPEPSFQPETCALACQLLRVVCWTGMLGLFSRTSAWLACGLTMYVLGVPQWFGKVNHYHHLVWVAAIMGASPCGDVLSIDAVVSAWRRGGRGTVGPPMPATAYGMPLRFVWLLLAGIYFFPGLWKLIGGGIDWVGADNLRYTLFDKWHELGGYRPPFRIDQYPTLCTLVGTATLVFELGFIGLIFHKRTRLLATVVGLSFHNGTFQFMRISFWYLQTFYVSLIDWSGFFGRVGAWTFPERLTVRFDDSQPWLRRAIGIIQAFDLLRRFDVVAAPVRGSLHAVLGGESFTGSAAWMSMIRRVPLLWPLLPLAFFCRATSIPTDRSSSDAAVPVMATPRSERPVFWIGLFLVIVNFACGVMCVELGWPFACYPTFRDLEGPNGESVEIYTLGEGDPERFDETPLRAQMRSERWGALRNRVANLPDPVARQSAMETLWQFLRDEKLVPADIDVELFAVRVADGPEERPPAEPRWLMRIPCSRE